MYTQCPDCATAFRVTADVLQQAAGQVRCGGCGHAFNALECLSEDPPEAAGTSVMPQTLEEFTGAEDIRIEDTGVEWRVIDENAVDEASGPHAAGEADQRNGGSLRWYIEEADHERASSGHRGDIPEITDAVPETRPDRQDAAKKPLQLDAAGDGNEELRFDDDTPLPDGFVEDFDQDEEPRRRAEDHVEPRSPEFDELQVDLALGEPGEWMELLDELPPDRFASEEGAQERLSRDEPSDYPTSGGDAADLDDTDIRPPEDAAGPAEAGDEDLPHDIDTQFDLQALEMGIDLTGSRDLQDDDDSGYETGAEWTLTGDEIIAETETGSGEARDAGHVPSSGEASSPTDGDEADLDLELADDNEAYSETDLATDGVPSDTRLAVPGLPVDVDAEDGADRQPAAAGHAVSPKANDDTDAHDGAPSGDPHLTEEELTINRLIDQDLLRYAAEQDEHESTGHGERQAPRAAPHVETIVMEGDFVSTALDDEHPDMRKPSGQATRDSEVDVDTWLGGRTELQGRQRRREPPSWGFIAGTVVLSIVLLAQVGHAYRETLVTNDAFDQTVGAVYRLFGNPVVPDWDARGWQFDATNGSTDETGEVLRISSQIANRSGQRLPYPLMYVSLTDRWEETVGASVLKPRDYLAADMDSGALIPAGESFAALITIKALSPDATGFKLSVCYPANAGQLRCAIEDFRN